MSFKALAWDECGRFFASERFGQPASETAHPQENRSGNSQQDKTQSKHPVSQEK
ncbi:MAG: hypothetical protein H0Z34_16235 [Brevibacillus sp.]|nr:hypothetical protein [Brevibacillus sp.]